MTYKDNLHTTY